jgi:hypothetical protein
MDRSSFSACPTAELTVKVLNRKSQPVPNKKVTFKIADQYGRAVLTFSDGYAAVD